MLAVIADETARLLQGLRGWTPGDDIQFDDFMSLTVVIGLQRNRTPQARRFVAGISDWLTRRAGQPARSSPRTSTSTYCSAASTRRLASFRFASWNCGTIPQAGSSPVINRSSSPSKAQDRRRRWTTADTYGGPSAPTAWLSSASIYKVTKSYTASPAGRTSTMCAAPSSGAQSLRSSRCLRTGTCRRGNGLRRGHKSRLTASPWTRRPASAGCASGGAMALKH